FTALAELRLAVVVALLTEGTLATAATAAALAGLEGLLEVDTRDLVVRGEFHQQVVDVVDLDAPDLVQAALGPDHEGAGIGHLPGVLAEVAACPVEDLFDQGEERLVGDADGD